MTTIFKDAYKGHESMLAFVAHVNKCSFTVGMTDNCRLANTTSRDEPKVPFEFQGVSCTGNIFAVMEENVSFLIQSVLVPVFPRCIISFLY